MSDEELLRDFFNVKAEALPAIWVEDPEEMKEVVSSWMGIEKTFLSYRILLKQAGRDVVGIRHRYSEFEKVRTDLLLQYCPLGIMVPSLPPKKPVSSLIKGSNDIFIKERTKGLTMFCEALVQNPFLRFDSNWLAFMKPSSAHTTASGLPNVPFYPDDHNNSGNLGLDMLSIALEKIDLPPKYIMMQKMTDLKDEVSAVERQLKTLADRVRQLQASERSLNAAIEGVNSALASMAEMEQSHVKYLGGFMLDATESSLRDEDKIQFSANAYSTLLVNEQLAGNNTSHYIGVLLCATLDHELSRIESFKELFKVHDDLVFTIDTALKADKLNKAAEGDAQLNKFYKGLFAFTLPCCSRQRAAIMRKTVSAMGNVKMSTSYKVYSDTVTFFSNLKYNYLDAMNETCHTLDLLSQAFRPR